MKKALWLGAIVLIIAGGIIFYLVHQANAVRETGVDALYDFSPVQRMDLSQKVDATGSVVSTKSTDIYPDFQANVKQVLAKAGIPVKKGDLLMVLESQTLEDQWTQANSTLIQTKISLEVAEKDLERTKILFNAQGTTIDVLEAAQSKVETLRDQLNSAQVKLAALAHQPDETNFMAPNHRDIYIRAPYSGIIAWVYAKPGDIVQTTTLLASVSEERAATVEAEVDESDISSVHVGQKATVTSSDLEASEFPGVVSEVSSIGKLDAGVVYFMVRVKTDSGAGVLKAAMTVDLSIETESHPNVLAVPANAVVSRRGRTMVAVRDKDQVSYVRVETGVKSNGFIEIVSGLNEGDLVATEKPKDAPVSGTGGRQNQQGQHGMGQGNPMRFGGFGR